MNPTKEQQQWLWEECGLTFTRDRIGTLTWHDPEGYFVDFGYPDIDLNNLFKYAPEYQQIIFQPGYCGITIDDKLYEGSGDTEEDALFRAWFQALGGKE